MWGAGFRVWDVGCEDPHLPEGPEGERSGVLNLRTTTLRKYAAVPRRARVEGSWTIESLNSRLESNKEEEREVPDSLKC